MASKSSLLDQSSEPGPAPEVLYRFPSNFFRQNDAIDDERWDWVRNSVLSGEFHFASPTTFNDSHDCSPQFSGALTPVERDVFLRHGVNRHYPAASKRARRRIRHVVEQRLADPEGMHRKWRELIDSFGVLCLTESSESAAMWGHYARVHQGLCLEIEVRRIPLAEAWLPMRVQYTSVRPTLRYAEFEVWKRNPAHVRQEPLRTLLVKSMDWSYEREWRMIDTGRSGVSRLRQDVVSGIILGCRASEELVTRVRALVAEAARGVRLYRAEPSIKTFAVEKRLIEG